MFSYVKVFSDPEVDSRLHLDILIFTDPLYLTVTCPCLVSLPLLEEFHAIST